MNILLIDAMGSFLDFAMRCEADGHTVKVFMPPKDCEDIGKGLITKVENWQSWMKWAELIITSDNARYIYELESWRNEGYPIFGSNKEITAWEMERGTGQGVLEAHDIPCRLRDISFGGLLQEGNCFVVIAEDRAG